jgi:SAM-dependent methyltransferase
MNTVVLNPVPNRAWQDEFDRLVRDPYLSLKYDRERRLSDKMEYVDELAVEIRSGGRVLDLGPGPGEFLEVARSFGCRIFGIDAAPGDSEMGDEYLRLSRLMTFRQQLPVWYVGFDRLLSQRHLPFLDQAFTFINSQGSIEQIFRSHLVGPRHRDTKDARLQSWTLDARMAEAFRRFFSEAHRILDRRGVLLIYGNGAANSEAYGDFIQAMTREMGLLTLQCRRNSRLHKLVKTR